MNFLQWNGAFLVADEDGLATEAFEPFDDLLGIGHAAAEEQELGAGRSQREGQLVIQAAVRVAEHLVFVHDEQGRAVAADEAVLLGLQGGDEDRRGKVLAQVAGGDADIPAARAPFGQFVIGQGAGGDGVNGLAAVFSLIGPKLENQGLARAGRGLDDDVPALAQGGDGLLLPEVGKGDALEGGKIFQLLGH